MYSRIVRTMIVLAEEARVETALEAYRAAARGEVSVVFARELIIKVARQVRNGLWLNTLVEFIDIGAIDEKFADIVSSLRQQRFPEEAEKALLLGRQELASFMEAKSAYAIVHR